MAGGAGGTVYVPWYATGFRADRFEAALEEIAPVAMRYNATDYAVYRSRDDRYKFFQLASFPDPSDWERYWYGEQFSDWRAKYSSWYQVPVLYAWHDLVTAGALDPEAVEVE